MKKQNKQVQHTRLQQGDVLIKRVDDLPAGCEIIEKDKLTLALGEATGHSHTVESQGAILFSFGTKKYMTLKEPAVIKHQEHKEFTVPAGTYEIDQVREQDYFAKMVRKVVD
jgi:hypothetical protein